MQYPWKVIVKGEVYGSATTLAEAQKVAKAQGGYVACECRRGNPAASQAPAETVTTLAADFGRLVRDVAKLAGATVESGPSAMRPRADGTVDANAILAKSNKAGRFTFSLGVSTSTQMLPFCSLSLFASSMRSFMYADSVLASTVRAIGKGLRADSLYSERTARSLATAVVAYMDEAASHTPEMAKLERADLYNGKTVKIGKYKVQRKNDLFSVDGGPFVTIQQAAAQVAGGKVANPDLF